jgi:hypothetical protein
MNNLVVYTLGVTSIKGHSVADKENINVCRNRSLCFLFSLHFATCIPSSFICFCSIFVIPLIYCWDIRSFQDLRDVMLIELFVIGGVIGAPILNIFGCVKSFLGIFLH